MGLTGAGGSILSVPVFTYLAKIDVVTATAYSLFVVGLTAFAGTLTHLKRKTLRIKEGLYYGIPSVISIILTREYFVQHLPEIFVKFNGYEITKQNFLMGLFSIFMIAAGLSMIKEKKIAVEENNPEINLLSLSLQGLLLGVVMGLLGAGGGFLIVPALVQIAKMPIKSAIATSMMIISVNAFSGFFGSIQFVEINWGFLISFGALMVAGVIAGSIFSTKINAKILKPAFGYFIILISILIIYKEFIN